jgi:hypothetical protein
MSNRRVLLSATCLLAVAFFSIAIRAHSMAREMRANETGIGTGAQAAASARCASAEYHQLDFWIGDWDAYDINDPQQAARLSVKPVVGGCALQEDYQQFDGMKGQSFSGYDANRGGWHQSWVTNGGTWLFMDGKMEGGAMMLIAKIHKGGQESLMKSSWTHEGANVRETATLSADNGATWKPMFDMIFKPHQDAKSGQ